MSGFVGIGGGIIGQSHNAVNFDGANDYITRGANLEGSPDSKSLTYSAWLRPDNMSQRMYLAYGGRIVMAILDTGDISISANATDGGNAFGLTIAAGIVAANSWNHIVVSVDTAADTLLAYVNNAVATLSSSLITTNAIIGYNTAPTIAMTIGAKYDTGANKYSGGMAELYLDNTHIDISTTSNREKFIKNKRPVPLGIDGSLPTGAAPLMYFGGETEGWHENKGTGGAFSETGELTTSTNLPVLLP